MLSEWEQQFVAAQRVARLATVDARGQPHVVPIVYALEGQRLVTPLDSKPKRVDVFELRRVRNIQANPQVAVVIDVYDEDWQQLAWVQIRGRAEIVLAGAAHAAGIAALVRKYPQYATRPLDGRPLIGIELDQVRSWRGDDRR
jgi:PPOX class probable F420-dependent enzyme